LDLIQSAAYNDDSQIKHGLLLLLFVVGVVGVQPGSTCHGLDDIFTSISTTKLPTPPMYSFHWSSQTRTPLERTDDVTIVNDSTTWLPFI
jgi:hypothetical protein